MGGVAGHLAHLYDNRELTFNEMKKILSLASSGELIGTEKTDGYNIYLGFKDGQARAARNKGDMRKGGMNTQELAAREFKGGPQVKKVYNDAFRAFEKAAQSLTPPEREAIFGPEGEVFYNTEIQGPGASNVVNYDTNVLSIHHVGHKVYRPETDKVETIDAEANSKVLDKVIDRFEQATAEENFSVRRTALLQLKKLDDDYDLEIALAKIRKAGFDGSMTIEEYLENNLLSALNEKLPYFSDQLKQDIVNRILKKEDSLSLTAIYKGFPPEQKQVIRQFVQDGDNLIKQAILPIEEAIHDFAVELLRGLHSAYVFDNDAEVKRLKSEVESAIRQIQSYSGEHSEEAQKVLTQQLRKIKHLDNINTTVEGFVFQYGDQMYKFTGNFAPINQLLGLFRYGRGAIPPIKKAELQEEGGDHSPEELSRRKVAVIPGKFKPPHKGHLQMVEHYAELADVVVILISPLSRTTESGIEISLEESRQIWEIYLSDSSVNVNNVIIAKSPYNSPVQSAYELVAGNVSGFQPAAGDLVIPGASTKPDPKSSLSDIERFARFHSIPLEKRSQGVTPANVQDYAFTPQEDMGYVMSARDFRKAIDEADLDLLSRYIPNSTNPETILDIIYDGDMPQKKTLTMEHLFSLVDEMFNKTLLEVSSEKQRKWACAQLGDNFKGDKKLTKKQAKEMCTSELEEGLEKFKNAISGIKKVGSVLKDISRFVVFGYSPEELIRMHDKMSHENPWYPDYLDPVEQKEEIVATLEILSDFVRRGYRPEPLRKNKAGEWIYDRDLDLDNYDDRLLNLWFKERFIPLNAKKTNELGDFQKMINLETGKTQSINKWEDPEYRMAALIEDEIIDETHPEEKLGLDTPTQAARRGHGPQRLAREEEELEEISAMAGGAVAGGTNPNDNEQEGLIR